MPQITMPQTLSFSKGADQGIAYIQSKIGTPLSLVLWAPRLAVVSFIATKELALYALPTACFLLANYITAGRIKPLDNIAKFVTKSYVEVGKLWVRSALAFAGATFVVVAVLAGLIHLAAIKIGLVPLPLNNPNNQLGSLNDILRNMGFRMTDNAQNPVELRIGEATGRDKQYQEHMLKLAKRGVKEILEDETLNAYLYIPQVEDEAEYTSVDRIIDGDADAVINVANYIQFLEIEGDLVCPETFEHNDRAQYNARRKEIQEIKEELDELKDKTKLKEALIKSNFDLLQDNSVEKKIAVRIGQLSGALHQGKLLNVSVLNVLNMEGSSDNLFGKACSEAAKEYKYKRSQN